MRGMRIMRLKDFQRSEETAVSFCPIRHLCPVGAVCGTENGERAASKIMPAVIAFDKGDLLWTDHRYEHHVFVVRSGVLSSMAHVEPDGEVPFTLFGAGIGIGIADLYVPYDDANTYHLHALVPGSICSLPSKPLKRCLEGLEDDRAQKILAASLYNQASGSLMQSVIASRPLLCERIAMLLTGLKTLAERSGTEMTCARITHDEIASLVLSDRASVTRVLHQMEGKGLVKLGYRSIEIGSELCRNHRHWMETCNRFSTVDQ